MCCFAGPVRSVSDTKIFARLTDRATQYIAYQMQFESDERNAMILPIPTYLGATEAAVKFIDLSDFDDLFQKLARAFPALGPLPMARIAASNQAAAGNLAVHQVGNFEASVVPTLEDFQRLDPRFVLPVETWQKIPQYRDYSFVVFQLEQLSGKPHPMAFEFETRMPDQLFFPTVHIHDGEVHPREEFDHQLYCQHAGFDGIVGDYTTKIDSRTGFTRSKAAAGEYLEVNKCHGLVNADLLVHRRQLKGLLNNQDTLAKASGHPTRLPRFRLRRKLGWPGTIALGGVAIGLPLSWIIHRRQAVRSANRPIDAGGGESSDV